MLIQLISKNYLLLYFIFKKRSQGFTLIELLVTVIIISILAAIALPNLLQQSNQAKQLEAKQNLAAVNRAQAAFRLDRDQFASAFDDLGLGSLTGTVGETNETEHYLYSISSFANISNISAEPKDSAIKGYRGAASRYTNVQGLSVTGTAVCEANLPGSGAFSMLSISPPDIAVPEGNCTNGDLLGR